MARGASAHQLAQRGDVVGVKFVHIESRVLGALWRGKKKRPPGWKAGRPLRCALRASVSGGR